MGYVAETQTKCVLQAWLREYGDAFRRVAKGVIGTIWLVRALSPKLSTLLLLVFWRNWLETTIVTGALQNRTVWG